MATKPGIFQLVLFFGEESRIYLKYVKSLATMYYLVWVVVGSYISEGLGLGVYIVNACGRYVA